MSATIKLEKNHFPVLLDELVSIISPLYSGTFIDCTLGNGGYSKEILKNKQNKVIAIDRDINAIEVAKQLKKKYNKQFNFRHLKFSEVNKIEKIGDDLKGIIFDLGFSLIQVRDPNKGISFYNQGKLDMRMGLNKTSADEAINNLSYSELNNIFKFLGEEKKSKLISKAIINERKKKLINTPDLVKIVDYAKNFKRGKTHNSTQIFQALRIYVNKEIHELIYGLINSFRILPIGGIIAVVTFHSIEDKIVKFFFKHYSENKNSSRYLPNVKKKELLFKLPHKKFLLPTADEIKKNPSSRSAKLRYATKINNNKNFQDFLKKFQHLLDIEKIKGKYV